MDFIDLHCDTLYKSATMNLSLDDKIMEVTQSENKKSRWLQCYAVWIPDDYTFEMAEELFFKSLKKLNYECKRLNIRLISKNENVTSVFKNNINTALLTVENAKVIGYDIKNIKLLSELGVKIITLTWNGSNQIGDGAQVTDANGLTDFGRKAVSEMEENGIVIDISHASDKLFYDVAQIASRPFIATHSDSRSVVNNKRNLTDEQFKIIVEKKGIVGINFHNEFLSENSTKSTKYDVFSHIEKFLSLGGENTICIGSDFDGCNLPCDMPKKIFIRDLYELFLNQNYNETLVRKIFNENALNFFENFDNSRIM